VALFAEFLAHYSSGWRDISQAYSPPQLPSFTLRNGLHVTAMKRHVDPITLKRYYIEDPDEIVPLGFFVRGLPYNLWGLIPMERRFLGVDHGRLSESARADPGTATFYFLGADKYGHDLFSRIIYGARISLTIGLVAIVITFFLGIIIGGISGFYGGIVDTLIQRSIEVINSIPHLPMWLAIGASLPSDWPALRTYFAITIVLSALGWTGLARVVRGKILSLREEDYAMAARLIGASHSRVMFRHLVPGFASHIIVALTLSVPGMILGETALSFLGLGLRPPVVSWGVLLQDTINLEVVANYPWLITPVFLIIVTVLSFNFLGDGLRDAADPYGRTG
jgi:peptide/nickel transport system permease protein